MIRFSLIAALLAAASGAHAQVRTSDTVVSNTSLQAELQSVAEMMSVQRNTELIDARTELLDQTAADTFYNTRSSYAGFSSVYGHYYYDPSLYSLPDGFWQINANSRYLYFMDFSNAVDPKLPDVPVNPNPFTRLWCNLRRAAGNSMGSNGVDEIPLTWRNLVDTYDFRFERQELSSAQQVNLVEGMEREILAGLSSNYVATSTTTRIIDFQSAASQANDPIVQADLEALGWSIVNATQMEKIINGFRWRVLHNS